MLTQTTAIRQAISARREREFERFYQFEKAKERQSRLTSVETFFDPIAIEQEAAILIERHEKKEIILPTQEYLDNARTALFEALTASGHLSRVALQGTPEQVGAQVLNRLLNGFSHHVPEHEQRRRFKEICEELVIQRILVLIQRGELSPDTEVLTISDYPAVMSDEAALSVGYNPYNKKGMVRSNSFWFERGEFRRVIEQVSRSNAHKPETAILFLQQHEVPVKREYAADIGLLGTQTIYSRSEFVEGVVDIQRRLDACAGNQVMYGESPSAVTPAYEDLRAISALREAKVGCFAKELAAYEELLDKQVLNGNLTHAESAENYMRKVRDLVRQICVLDPGYARAAFGEEVVSSYEEASQHMKQGDSAGASAIITANAGKERAVAVCGMSIAAETMTAAQQGELANALKKKQELWLLWPKHGNDPDYLRRKYKRQKLFVDNCQACNKKRYHVGCSICPACDWKDTRSPGYVEAMIKRRSRVSLSDIIDNWFQERRAKQETTRVSERANQFGKAAVQKTFWSGGT